jgi:acetoin:2,6-dichlorophenolindophenol oxidoreductase subunit alpha
LQTTTVGNSIVLLSGTRQEMVMDVAMQTSAEMYRRMFRSRSFELAAIEKMKTGQIPGALHTSVGQEASIVGSCMALRDDDYMVGNHRSHGHPIGKGARTDRLFAELMGKATGINSGLGGSMHLSDFSVGSLGETSIVGSGLPVATGAALGSKMQGNDRVTLCFFGDGASNEGTFHESLNLAAVWQLPVVFLCENNGYGELSAASIMVSVPDVSMRAAGYGIPGVTVDGQDVLAVYEAASEAVARARRGDGASLVETKTYRFHDHAFGLPAINYRDQAEIDEWRRRDPVELFRARLTAEFGFDESAVKAIEDEVAAEIEAAVAFAESSPYPDLDAAFEHVYTNPIPIRR